MSTMVNVYAYEFLESYKPAIALFELEALRNFSLNYAVTNYTVSQYTEPI